MSAKDNGELPAQWIPQFGGGLSKRELLAAMAMQGLLASDVESNMSDKNLAEYSVAAADALLAQLEVVK